MATACSCENGLEKADAILAGFGHKITGEDLIPLLQQIQAAYGHLPPPVLVHISQCTGIPASRIHSVVTFYAQFHTEPRGKHTITFCAGTSCHVRGGKKLIDMTRQMLGIDEGETTEDMRFTLDTVACLGACALAPVMVVDGTYHGKLTPRQAERILRQLMEAES